MYILKNAIKNVWRNKSRNILVGIIILGIISATVVAFSINTTTSEIIKDYKNRFGSEVSISPDMEKLMNQNQGQMVNLEGIDSKKYIDFADSGYLKESILTSEAGLTSDSLKSVGEGEEDDTMSMGMTSIGLGGEQVEYIPPTLRVIGSSNFKSLEEFKSGKRKIIDGTMYENKDDAIVSKEFAELNNIKVGDMIEVKNPMGEKTGVYKLKVAGIYFDSTDEYGGMPFKSVYTNKRNEILCNIDTLSGILGEEELFIQAKYYLKDPKMIKDFEEEVRAKGLPDTYSVATDEASYNRIVGPVEGLGSISLMFILVVLALGSLILILLNTISIRERKYEIGVLRAIGMKKSKIMAGLIIESLLITTIALGVGVGAGATISQPVSNSLLEKQIESQNKNQNTMTQGFVMSVGSVSGEVEETISEIDVKINGEILLKVIIVALFLVVVSSIVGANYITKYEPRKILTDRG